MTDMRMACPKPALGRCPGYGRKGARAMEEEDEKGGDDEDGPERELEARPAPYRLGISSRMTRRSTVSVTGGSARDRYPFKASFIMVW